MSSVASASDPFLSRSRMMRGRESSLQMKRRSGNDGQTFLSVLRSVRPGDGSSRCRPGWIPCLSHVNHLGSGHKVGKARVKYWETGEYQSGMEDSEREAQPGCPNNLLKTFICRLHLEDLADWHVQISSHKVMMVLKQEPCLTGEHNPSSTLHITLSY